MDNQQASDADFTRPSSDRDELSENVPPPNTIVFRQDEPYKQLLVISEKMGTVDIKLDAEWLRMLTLAKPEAMNVYNELRNEVLAIDGQNERTFNDVLHVLLSSAINAFHQNVYAMCHANSGIPMPNNTGEPNVD